MMDVDLAVRTIEPPPPGGSIDPFVPIRSDVDDVLSCFLGARTVELAMIDDHLVAVVTREITDLVAAGGKRLRPAFVYWGHRATGADHDPAVAQLAAAVEMVHTFALLHDDVMDRALTRRGRAVAAGGSRTRTKPTGSKATVSGSEPARRSSQVTWPSSGPTSSWKRRRWTP